MQYRFSEALGDCALRLYHLGVLARTDFAANVYNNNVHLQGMNSDKHVHEAVPCYPGSAAKAKPAAASHLNPVRFSLSNTFI